MSGAGVAARDARGALRSPDAGGQRRWVRLGIAQTAVLTCVGAAVYQACVLPQCGHATLVETGAMKKHPHEHG
jgi:hypothetical protein